MSRRLSLTTAPQIQKSLGRIANMVLNGEIDPKEANAMTLACNAALSALKVNDQLTDKDLEREERRERISYTKAQTAKAKALAILAQHDAEKASKDSRSFELLSSLVKVMSASDETTEEGDPHVDEDGSPPI